MEKVKRFIKTTFVYFVGQALSKLVSIFLLPVYTSRLIPDQLGMYDLATTIINLIVPIAFVQIWDGAFRFAFDKTKNYDNHYLINNSLIVFIIGAIPCALLLYASTAYFGLGYKGLIIAYGLFYCLQYIYTFSARMYLDNRLFVLSGAVCTLVCAAVNIILIVGFNMKLESLYIAQIVGCIVQILMIEAKLKVAGSFDRKDIDWGCIGLLIRFTLPLCITTVSYWLLNGFTRVVINKKLGAYDNGIFAVANKFATMVTFVTVVLQYSWNEIVYISAKEDEGQNYSDSINLILKTMLYAGGGLCLLVKLVFPFMIDSQYDAAKAIIPAVIMGVAFNAVATLLNPLLLAEKKSSAVMISTLIGAVLNVLLCWISADRYGLQGIAVSLGISFAVVMLMKLISLRKLCEHRFDPMLVFDLAFCILNIWLYYHTESVLVMIGMTVLAVCLYLFGIRKYITGLINLRKN